MYRIDLEYWVPVAGPGMRQAHHLRRMPMGGIGGIFNLYFILKLLNS